MWTPAGSVSLRGPAEKRIQEVSAIYEISQAIDSVPIDDLLKLITEKAAAVMDAQACSLMLKDPQRDELVIKASHGLSEEIVEETRVSYGEGIAGRVAQTGQPMLLTNLRDDPRFADSNVTPRPDIVSSICVPLKDEEGRIQGVLSIRRRSPAEAFTEDDVKLFSVFASQTALAISNAHLYANLNDRVQELSTLYEASRQLSEAYSLEDAARALVQVATHMTGRIPALLLLTDRSRGASVQAASGVRAKVRKSVADSVDDSAMAWMNSLREPRSFSLESLRRCPSAIKPLAAVLQKAFSRAHFIPLVAEDSVLGALILGIQNGRRSALDSRRIRLLSIVASQAATIMKNASRYEEQIDQRVLELSALYALSERISTAANLKEALDSILDIVRDIVWYDESFISTVDYERKVMTVQACRGLKRHRLRGAEIPFTEDGLSSWAIRERKALVSPDISKDSRFKSLAPGVRSGVVRSLMAIPLIVHDEVVGVLNVHSYAPNMYTEENVRILSVIASQAAALYKELEALSALANYTDNILRSIAAGVLTLDKDGNVLTWNKAAEDIIGIPAAEAVGRHFSEVVDRIGISQADKERTLSAINCVFETGEKFLGYKQEYHPVDRDTVCVNMNVAQLRDHTGEMLGLVIIFEDVTKELQLEEEMHRISELAAIGQLAATIAHELRNPLSSIKGAAQYLRKEYEDHVAVREFLDIIIDEVNVLNKITTEFLDFARPTKLNLRETDINDILFRTLQFMQLDITKQNVEVEQKLPYDMPKIIADDKQLEQVMRNIVLNAIQAMPEGGTLMVSSRAAGDGVKLVVADTGMGIPEDKLSQLFVPFFTTKTKGTGLGLSIVQKIVENHGGRVTVKSEIGKGTTFEVFLPICSEKAKAAIIQAEGAAARGDAALLRRAQAGL
jgi:PAS domain S-box-containing protein